jgi:hypothetical protein
VSGHGAREVVELTLSWALTTAWAFAVVIGDERDLDEEQLARAWPRSSRAAALVGLGILAVPFHFARTRGAFWPPRRLAERLVFFAVGIGATAGALLECGWLVATLLAALGYR